MKKLLIVFFLLCSMNVFAEDLVQPVKKIAKGSVSITGFGYFATADNDFINDNIGNGGGIGLKVKGSVNRYLGFSTEFIYTNAKQNLLGVVNLNSNIIDIRESLVLQYETYKGETGLVPWLSVGVGVTFYILDIDIPGYYVDYPNATGYNINIAAGLKYNFKTMFAGVFVDWTYSNAFFGQYVYGLYAITDGMGLSAVRAGVELGFRYH